MKNEVTIQRFTKGCWIDVASVALAGDPSKGLATPTVTAYLIDYAIENLDRRDAAALSAGLPVQLDARTSRRWPAFLVDLLPQGYGRAELLQQLGHSAIAGPEAEWPLLLAGAGNPIGHLRVREAFEWLCERSGSLPSRGFSFDEIAARSDDFVEFLASHGLFVAGSSGVQGEWPKILLTEDRNGLLHLDHALPDELAHRHWLVKFGRGTDAALARILELEAPYMRVARRLGLRVHGDLALRERALFIPRFDRRVEPTGVERVAQESIASLCGIAEFGAAPSHNRVVRLLGHLATNPEVEILEYVRRDIVNVALGNRDNHARNTAVNRLENGTLRLTPLFDFAPMMLHPDGIARRMRWESDDRGSPRWPSIVEQCREASGLPLTGLPAALRELGAHLAELDSIAKDESIPKDILGRQNLAIAETLAHLEAV